MLRPGRKWPSIRVYFFILTGASGGPLPSFESSWPTSNPRRGQQFLPMPPPLPSPQGVGEQLWLRQVQGLIGPRCLELEAQQANVTVLSQQSMLSLCNFSFTSSRDFPWKFLSLGLVWNISQSPWPVIKKKTISIACRLHSNKARLLSVGPGRVSTSLLGTPDQED